MQLQPFLTSYDPTDLPGGSVDPLGFDRGYTWLAEKILPGLTNAADQPRYLSTLCAALVLAEGASSATTPRERERVRREVVLRAERFWVLACVLATAARLRRPRRHPRHPVRPCGGRATHGARST